MSVAVKEEGVSLTAEEYEQILRQRINKKADARADDELSKLLYLREQKDEWDEYIRKTSPRR